MIPARLAGLVTSLLAPAPQTASARRVRVAPGRRGGERTRPGCESHTLAADLRREEERTVRGRLERSGE